MYVMFIFYHTHHHHHYTLVKIRLETAAAFMILGIIATFVAVVLFFPFFHWILFVAGSVVSFASSKTPTVSLPPIIINTMCV